jgi:hypothetical protein
LDVLAQFVELHIATLISGAHPCVDGDDHITMSALMIAEVNQEWWFRLKNRAKVLKCVRAVSEAPQ